MKNHKIDSIEVAHAYFTGDAKSDFEFGCIHAGLCKRVIENYSLSYHTAFVCLVDDRRLRKKDRHLLTPGILGIRSILKLDYILYETDLNKYKKDWLALQKNASEISGSIKRDYNHSLQCSHYIAIWYCLRTGILQDIHNILMPVSLDAIDGYLNPFGPEQVSILPSEYVEYEEMAVTKFLSQMTVPEPLINRFYYVNEQSAKEHRIDMSQETSWAEKK